MQEWVQPFVEGLAGPPKAIVAEIPAALGPTEDRRPTVCAPTSKHNASSGRSK